MKRLHIWITGRVQGVFFRANTRRKAMNLNLKGWVKNLDDGKVEVVAEGKEPAIKKLVEFCKKGPFGAKVDDVTVKEEKYQNKFKTFEIRY